MPGFDRTGPRGQGPLTGGGRGPCGGGRYANRGDYSGYGLGRGGRPYGGGRGYGYGGGRGMGRGGWVAPDYPVEYVPEAPVSQPANYTTAISDILGQLNHLVVAVAELHDRFRTAPAKSDPDEGLRDADSD
ncbi:DUF5320 domain-containing protein [bacterium]|nr:DUF5320 domain-containing protein [bacterium]